MNIWKNKKGMTMAELMVTITIMVIVGAVVTTSIFAYQRYANFKRQNETAHSLFVAAQSALTQFSQNGEAEEIDAGLARFNRLLTKEMLAGEAANQFDETEEGRIYYLTINKDGTVYDATTQPRESAYAKEVFDRIFADYVYDKNILNEASITIEFDAAQGVVYSVLYSDMQRGFSYGSSGDYASIANRDTEERRKQYIGYYGITDISGVTSRTKEKPVIEKVELINSNALYLRFRLSDKYAKTATGELSYDLEFYSADTENRMILMSMTLSEVQALYQNSIDVNSYADLTKEIEVKYYNTAGEIVSTASYPFLAYVDDNYQVHLYVDSVDLSAHSMQDTNAIAQTASAERFGFETMLGASFDHNIYVNVRGQGAKYKTSAWKRSNEENLLYASGSTGDGTKEYTITNARHLYNLRYAEELLSLYPTTNTYRVTNDFCWIGEDSLFDGQYGSDVFTSYQEMPARVEDVVTAFPHIASLSQTSTLTSTTKTIFGLVINESGITNLGLFGQNYGSITNLTIADATIVGGNAVGTFCGENYGQLENLTTKDGQVSGNTDVGGIFGSSAKSSATYRNLTNGNDVEGTQYVGGIVGSLTAAGNNTVIIEDCENTGLITARTGEELDPNEKILQTLADYLLAKLAEGVDVNVDGTDYALSSKDGMYNYFKQLNGGWYPGLAQYDAEVLQYLIQETNATPPGITGYGSVQDLINAYVWVPIVLVDPNGNIKIGNTTYSLGLASRCIYDNNGQARGEADMLNQQNGYLVYYNGRYYYNLHPYQNRLNTFSVANKSPLSTLISRTSISMRLGSGSLEPSDNPDVTTFQNEPSYLGGIVGYGENITVRSCTANPTTTNQTISDLLAQNDEYDQQKNTDADPILGVYSGGIIGYGKNTTLRDVSTTGGFVVGSHYVGGIAGFLESCSLDQEGRNVTNVIGNYYVGGIVGANSVVGGKDENGFITVKEDYTNVTLSNWVNRGIVIATKAYGGGIAGLNAGNLKNCGSDMPTGDFLRNLSNRYGGDYIGGIAGFNSGKITCTNSNRANLTSYVSGRNFVGGIVGLNHDNSEVWVSGYRYSAGYVNGQNFVGGYIGLNLSTNLFADEDGDLINIQANPNRITGRYFVGGVLGGNLLASNKHVEASFNTNNFLGTLEANAFAGGYIGLNMLVNATSSSSNNIKNNYENLAKLTEEDALEDALALVELVTNQPASNKSFYISGQKGTTTTNKFGGITAEIYVGGVLGYNAINSAVYIENVVNKSPIYATSSLDIAELSGRDNQNSYTNQTKRYAYAGGIVGKCTKYMTLVSCSADDSGRVQAAGTYLGGLVEVNEGVIDQCSATTLGATSRNYVGGLVGLNKKTGTITAPKLSGKTITGRNVVGGIVAENFGAVEGVATNQQSAVLSGRVVANGENIGGIIGYNRADGSLKYGTISIAIDGNGENVGGAVGNNQGLVSNIVSSASGKVTVAGNAGVGGIIGLNTSTVALTGMDNHHTVTANYGSAGGIVGIQQKGSLRRCVNYGKVTTLGVASGYTSLAGGIAGALQNGTVTDCENQGAVEASKGTAGGLVGENHATVSNSRVTQKATVKGALYSGGAVGQNHNIVTEISVEGCTVENMEGAKNSAIGGVVGQNDGQVQISNGVDCTVRLLSGGGHGGGIVGVNNDTVDQVKAYGTTLTFRQVNMNYFGNLGGIVGNNRGVISNATFGEGSTINGTANDPSNPPKYNPNYDYEDGIEVYGYGGIAGVNGTAQNQTVKASIENCTVTDATISVLGSVSNIANVGGVAGVNGKDATIDGITYLSTTAKPLAVKAGASGQTAFANVGGAVGYNYGTISKVGKAREVGFGDGSTAESEAARRASADDNSMVEIFTNRGHIGGIVGFNRTTAVVRDCATGANWTIYGDNSSTDNGTGGIVGYNMSSYGLRRCDNWASVKRVNSITATAGIVGRQETSATSTWEMRDCNNMGSVEGARVGGVIGSWKYSGGSLINCSNYGTIKNTKSGEYVGGMVGLIYSLTNGEYATLSECKNFGSITSTTSTGGNGGMIGAVGSRNIRVKVALSDCINTGTIRTAPGEYSAGMVGRNLITNVISGESYNMTFKNCMNFGVPESGTTNFSGIIAQASSGTRTLIQDCIGVAGSTTGTKILDYPITNIDYNGWNSSSKNNNLYFTQDGKAVGKGVPMTLSLQSASDNRYEAYIGTIASPALINLIFGAKTPTVNYTYQEYLQEKQAQLTVTGGNQNNARQTAFLSLNSKLSTGDDSAKPTVSAVTAADDGGSVALTWNSSHALYFMVKATFSDGSVLEDTVYGQRWVVPTTDHEGETITFTVTAVAMSGEQVTANCTYQIKSNTLPTPDVQLVLYSVDQEKCYRVYINNAEAYQAAGGATIPISIDGAVSGTITINASGYTPLVIAGKNVSNYLVSAQASPLASNAAQYGKSAMVVRETVLPKNTNYRENNSLTPTMTKIGFSGDTPESLSYTLRVAGKSGSSLSVFYRHDLVAEMQVGDLVLPVVIGKSEGQVTGGITANVSIIDLPTDFGDRTKYQNPMVQSYPSFASNQIVYLYRELGTFTAEELQTLKVSTTGELNGTVSLVQNGSLQSGYSLTLQTDGNYALSFSPLLQKASTVTVTDGTMSYQTYTFSGIADDVKTAPTPQITTGYSEETESYEAKWQVDAVEGYTPWYTYSLDGVTINGTTINILKQETASQVSALKLNTADWNYAEVILTVHARGAQTGTSTTFFGSEATARTTTKIKLDQMTAPVVNFIDQNEVSYRVSFNGIEQSNDGYPYISHYRVEMTAEVEGVDGMVTAQYETADADTTAVMVDFDALRYQDEQGDWQTAVAKSGSVVNISVRAIAVADGVYGNGPAGVTTAFEVPTRLVTPNPDYCTVEPNFILQDGLASITQFEKEGFAVGYADSNSPNKDEMGSYQLAAKVVGQNDAETVLYTKENPLVMQGTKLGETVTQILKDSQGISADDTGGKLVLSLRAVSDSHISSYWSAEKTVTLPTVQVEPVDLLAGLATEKIDVAIYQGGDDTGSTERIQQTVLSWQQARYQGGYRMALTRKDNGVVDYIDISMDTTAEDAKPTVTFYDGTKAVDKDGTLDYGKGEVLGFTETTQNRLTSYTFDITGYRRFETVLDSNAESTGYELLLLSQLIVEVQTNTDGSIRSVDYRFILPDAVLTVVDIPNGVESEAYDTDTLSVVSKAMNTNYRDAQLNSIKRNDQNVFEKVDEPEDVLFPFDA